MVDESTAVPLKQGEAKQIDFDKLIVLSNEDGKLNPRKNFDREALDDLKKSIDSSGLIQPPPCRPAKGKPGYFELIAGERRSIVLTELHKENPKKWPKLPILVMEVADDDIPIIQLVENLQREDLTPIEIADGLAQLLTKKMMNEDQIAAKMGWSLKHVRRHLQLTRAPEWIREAGKRVNVIVKKTDENNEVVVDPKTQKPLTITKAYPALEFSFLLELIRLHNKLTAVDKDNVEKGTPDYKPAAQKEVKRLIEKCAAEQWSRSKLEGEIDRTIGKYSGEPREKTERAPYQADAKKIAITAEALKELSPGDLEILARSVEKFFREAGFKTAIISPT